VTSQTTHASSPLHLELPQLRTPLQPLETARSAILAPSGLDEDRIARVLGNVMGHSVDYADLYFQLVREESCVRWQARRPASRIPTKSCYPL
jgi:hypothetical protein